LSRLLRRTGTWWLTILLSASVVIAGALVAGASVVNGHRRPAVPVICRKDGRRTIHYRGVGYIVRNDVFYPERECIKLQKHAVGFVVTKSGADSHVDDNEAFPEVIYGCAWGVCTYHSSLPRNV
jgi:hypothetical protein